MSNNHNTHISIKFITNAKNIGAYERVTQMTSHYSVTFPKDERKAERRSWARRECGLCKLINAPVVALHDPLASMERKKVIGHELYVNPYGSTARRNIRSGGG